MTEVTGRSWRMIVLYVLKTNESYHGHVRRPTLTEVNDTAMIKMKFEVLGAVCARRSPIKYLVPS